ncbi:LacI family DNA-binding transcriptional regulator [Flavivirga spongiicola]|uniref:LacI family transcriptional regulator n=1 Tax=Flavivirga spongiicola TaxID=421621 RepID=A0ABU7XPG9_9FLAO|nr:LacI family DNA-binding transcriptional regulator [Flavivirga sp. MEBiC05379]MDO5977338.1 LacI family DNA-binding transcriptional regulator [Flavivirga sp. MEBiC05379]
MSSKRVTISDIAQKLNISASTVSRALKNHPALKKETIKAVQDLANKLNYQPNLLALSLRQKKTNTIGVIIPEITSHFFSSIITGIQDVLVNSGYNIIICQSNESYKEELAIVENLLRIRVDGVLVSPSSRTKKFNHFSKLKQSGVPIVVFDRDCPNLEVDKVLVDDYDGAFQAIDYLIKSGCKKIAHLSGPKNLSTTNHRLQGYLDALKKNNLPVKEEYIVHASGFTHEEGIQPTKTLLRLKNPPDAIFAINDCIAISAMYIAKKLDFKIPEDISIIGFDDEPHTRYFKPALSTVWQPVYSIGMLSARILLSHLKNPDNTPKLRKEIFKPELVIRHSSIKI